jgi:hypothetical protein
MTFKVNIHAIFYLTEAAVPHMKPGSAIVNTASVNSDMPNPILLAYTTTKGAIHIGTRRGLVTPGDIVREWWARSSRNGGRDQIGTVGEIIPEWWATSSGISMWATDFVLRCRQGFGASRIQLMSASGATSTFGWILRIRKSEALRGSVERQSVSRDSVHWCKWRTRHDSNVWPSPSEGDALSS